MKTWTIDNVRPRPQIDRNRMPWDETSSATENRFAIRMLHQGRREENLLIQIHGVSVGHTGNKVTNNARFERVTVLETQHIEVTQIMMKQVLVFHKIGIQFR